MYPDSWNIALDQANITILLNPDIAANAVCPVHAMDAGISATFILI